MKRHDDYSYNERLFDSGFRSKLHLARFLWMRKVLHRLNCPRESLVELGCFDAKLLKYLPEMPKRYAGYDAGWEGGLDQARQQYADKPEYTFTTCQTVKDFSIGTEQFDLGVAMETLEHLPDAELPIYFERFGRSVRRMLITVPNEKGPVFAAKWAAKRFLGDHATYTPSEYWSALLGHCDRVARDEHKGFDYAKLIEKFSQHFVVESVTGLPFEGAPVWMGFTIAIMGRSKYRS
jgi:hypothetical protein